MKHIILIILLTIGVFAEKNYPFINAECGSYPGFVFSPKNSSLTLFDGCKTFVNFSDKGANKIIASANIDSFSQTTSVINGSEVVIVTDRKGSVKFLNIENGQSNKIIDLNFTDGGSFSGKPYINVDGNRLLIEYLVDGTYSTVALLNPIKNEVIFTVNNFSQASMSFETGEFVIVKDEIAPALKRILILNQDGEITGEVSYSPSFAEAGFISPVLSPNRKIIINAVFDLQTRKYHIDGYDIAKNQKLYRIDTNDSYLLREKFIHKKFNTNEMILRKAKKIGIYEISTGMLIRELPELSKQNVFGIAYLNENIVITNDMRIWDIKNDKELLRLYIFENGEWVIVAPDGSFECSANGLKVFNDHIKESSEKLLNEAQYNPQYVQKIFNQIMKQGIQ
jgi:hypothetical protein